VERVLVTGPGGFVGRHLQGRLQDRFIPFEGDVLDASALAASVRDARPDALVHLAALSSVGDSWGDAREVWRTNVLGTVNVLEALTAEAPEARLLFVSSGEVYGRAAIVPTPEEAAVEPVSPYGASKAAAELACRQAAGGLDVVIARAFPHVGPGQDQRFAVASWASQLARLHAEGGGVLRVGDLDVERDLTDVRDVCRAYESLLDRAAQAGTYNISTGTPVPLKRVVELLVKAVAAPVQVERDEARIRPAEVRRLAGDPSKLRAATGWMPEIPLERTLRDVLAATLATAETETIPSG
jgi:GDP-4-dehydro-6-deoxy-D-mannose reductase